METDGRIDCEGAPMSAPKRNPDWEEREQRVVRQIDGHFCNDWDGLAVSAWTQEYDGCVDFKKSWLGRVINRFCVWQSNLWSKELLSIYRCPYCNKDLTTNDPVATVDRFKNVCHRECLHKARERTR